MKTASDNQAGPAAPRVSVVIPCFNEARHIERLLDALAGQDYTCFEIIIVDGQSVDGTPEIVQRHAACNPCLSLFLLTNPDRAIPTGVNLGIRHARGQIIVRLDGHCHPSSDYLSRCLQVLSESAVDVVGGVWDILPGAPTKVATAIARAVSSPLGAGDAFYRLTIGRQPRDVDTVPFGCYRRQLWQALGGYNEHLKSNEDYEFNLRVRLQGGRVRLDPSIRCAYYARPSFRELGRQYWRYGWWKAQMLKKYPLSIRFRQVIPLVWSLFSLLGLAGALVFPAWRAWVLASWAAYAFALILSATRLTASPRDRTVWLSLIAAYVVIHYGWGLGAWSGFLGGRAHR